MADGLQETANAFAEQIRAPAPQPRDDSGRFTATGKPETMFEPRAFEGDPTDGGDDARLRRQEERANGEGRNEDSVSVDGRVSRRPSTEQRAADGEHPAGAEEQSESEEEPDELDSDLEEPDEGTDAEGLSEQDGQTFEVTVDGQQKHVTLKEALEGYIRTDTFHQRMSKLSEASQTVAGEAQRVAEMRDGYIQRLSMLEEEVRSLMPAEPNWDAEFQQDPAGAHRLQKQFQAIYGKLNEIRANRDRAFQERNAEQARYTETYAKNEFSKFVMDNKIPDATSLQKEIGSMRKTALSAGFSEQEIATVYDSRMLTILRKASRYDRMMKQKPQAVVPGRGKTLQPGSAPRIGDQARKGLNEAQQRLARTGRLDDAAAVFNKIIR